MKILITVGTGFISENYDTKDFYNSTKFNLEAILKCYSKYHYFKVGNLLLADTFCINDKRDKLINISLYNNKFLKINNLENKINYTYIDDVIRALNQIINYKWNNFCIFNKKSISIFKLIKLIEKLKKKGVDIEYEKKYKKKNTFKFKPRSKKLIEWNNQISISEGIKKCLKSKVTL